MNLNEEVELLKGVPIFAKIEPAKLKLLAFTSERMNFAAGQEVCHQGDQGDAMYVILGGTADVLIDTPGGQIAVAEMKKNGFFGEIAILCDVPRTATIKAREPLQHAQDLQGHVLSPGRGVPADGGRDHARAGASRGGHQPEAARGDGRTRRPDQPRMSRLDSFIARMQAQRDCLNFLKPAIDALRGPILEVGLGNGRTYDHLRDLFPGRDIYVFERQVAAHPDCIPPDDRLFLGEAREAIPRAAQTARRGGGADPYRSRHRRSCRQHGDGQVAGPGARRAGRRRAATCSPTSRSTWRAGNACPSRPACRRTGISSIG